MRSIHIATPTVKLDALLKLAGVVPTGGQAKLLLRAGGVTVNGALEQRRGRKIRPGDRVQVADREGIEVTGD